MTGNRRLSIILPSFNDPRIEESISSIRRFDDINVVSIVVIDGGSSTEIQALIQGLLSKDDLFVSEPDNGIFDALNKGLDKCETEYIGWLGSDDVFSGDVYSSEVVAGLAEHDLYVANLYFVLNGRVTRKTLSWPSKHGLVKWGFHNPHYATFGRASLLKGERFLVDSRSSDIEYFLRIFKRNPRVATTAKVATWQGQGGFSNSSLKNVIRSNLEMIRLYERHDGVIVGAIAVALKLLYKVMSRAYFALVRVQINDGV